MSKDFLQHPPGEGIRWVVENHPDLTFAKLTDGLIKAKGMRYKDIAQKTGLDPKIFTRINDGHIPRKVTVLTIGVALALGLSDIEIFLWIAGYCFSPTELLDQTYQEVISNVDLNDIDRITSCNDMLKERGISSEFLLGGKQLKE